MEEPDSFCWDCGEPYPWASREERVVKLFDRIDHEDFDAATLLTVRDQIAILSAPVNEAIATSGYKPATGSWIWPPGRGRRCCLSCKAC